MLDNGVPPDGELRVGTVALPYGRRVLNAEAQPVAWGTIDPVAQSGNTWIALSEIRRDTGLVPVLMGSKRRAPTRPWDEYEFTEPTDLASIGAFDPAGVLARAWNERVPVRDDWEDSRDLMRPFGREFPGLAPAEPGELSSGELRQALEGVPAMRVGLVPAARPADALARLGWYGASQRFEEPLALASVLRSWEDRFGAFLFYVGLADIRLVVRRPPRTESAATRIAAEHYAFADEWGGRALGSVADIGAMLVNSPVWAFWWD